MKTKKEFDKEALRLEINKAYEGWKAKGSTETDWGQNIYGEIVDYVIDRPHACLNDELPALGQFVTKIPQPHLLNLYRLYNRFMMDIEKHMTKEEIILFPRTKQYEENPARDCLKRSNV